MMALQGLPTNTGWRQKAACRGVDPEIFHPSEEEDAKAGGLGPAVQLVEERSSAAALHAGGEQHQGRLQGGRGGDRIGRRRGQLDRVPRADQRAAHERRARVGAEFARS